MLPNMDHGLASQTRMGPAQCTWPDPGSLGAQGSLSLQQVIQELAGGAP